MSEFKGGATGAHADPDDPDDLVRSPEEALHEEGTRFHHEKSYSADKELDAIIRQEIEMSRHTVASISPGKLRRIMRLFSVPNDDIFRCSSHHDLVNLALERGIADVPDDWTLQRLDEEQKAERARAYRYASGMSGRDADAAMALW